MSIEGEIEQPKRVTRPSEFTDEIFTEICERMAEGKTLRQICSDTEMPARSTVLRWVRHDDARKKQYEQARQACMDWYADEIIDVAWDTSKDTIKGADGKPDLCNHEWINRSRLKVDTLKFLMAKLHPGRYGDKTQLELPAASADGLAISWGPSVRVIAYPLLGSDGRLLKDGPEYDAAIERAIQEAKSRGATETAVGIPLNREEASRPAQLTYQPEPLPGGLTDEEWSLMHEVLTLVKRTIPSDQQSAPEPILRIIREALLLHFRETEIEPAAMAS